MERVRELLLSPGIRHGAVMAGATVIAGGLDYGFNVLTGRWLEPNQYGAFIAVTALLQVLVHLTNVIRNVVAYYTAERATLATSQSEIAIFFRGAWHWAWRWGFIAFAVLALLSGLIANLLRLETAGPMLAASLALLFLFVRPVTDGTLQGTQSFTGLSLVQITQAVLRLIFAIFLIRIGWEATGAIIALPFASAGALLLAIWLLRDLFRTRVDADQAVISWQYSLTTLLGLGAFALIANMDALVVKRLFDPDIAGNYGPVVTLGKINLFVPLAMGLVLFPKVTQRQALGQNPRPILFLSLAVTILPGLAVTTLYFLFPGLIVETIFTDTYRNPGQLLGLVGLATTLFAGINIWLNYALSLDRATYIYVLLGLVLLMLLGMIIAGSVLINIGWIMVVTGLLANLAGMILLVPIKAT